MTEFIKLQTPQPSIPIGFTDQTVRGRAGLLTFAGLLQRLLKKDLIWQPTDVPGTEVAEVGPRK